MTIVKFMLSGPARRAANAVRRLCIRYAIGRARCRFPVLLIHYVVLELSNTFPRGEGMGAAAPKKPPRKVFRGGFGD